MKIVVHGTNWIGDAVMTIPALRELRRVLPEAHITLYTRSWAKGIFRDCEFIDEILCPKDDDSRIRGLFPEVKLWKNKRFDLALLFTNSFRTALIAKLGGARQRFGFTGEGRRLLLTEAVARPPWKDTKHEVYYYLELLSAVEKRLLGTDTVSVSETRTLLSVNDKRRKSAREILARAGADLSRPTVGFGVGSQNSEAKRWLPERFAALCDRLQDETGAGVVLLGSGNESGASAQVLSSSGEQPIDLTGKTTLDEAVAILAELDSFVSNDMGLAHISSAVGTKTITIFGPTNPLTTRPWNGVIVRRNDVDCSPCMLRHCPIDHRCMTRIDSDIVFEKVSELLAD